MSSYLFSVDSRTTRRAAWLASCSSRKLMESQGMAAKRESLPSCWRSTECRVPFTLYTANTPSCPTAVTRSPFLGTRFFLWAMNTVSHRAVGIHSPVDFKLHHYRTALALDTNSRGL